MSIWKYEIRKNYGIKYLDTIPLKALWVTHCSKTKTGKTKSVPKEFYVSPRCLLFYTTMEKYNFPYGIISDKYGIHFYDEELEWYDIHPSKLSIKQKMVLGKIIKEKLSNRKYENMVYYAGNVYLWVRPYLEILKYSGIPTFYVQSLKNENLFRGR